MPLEKERPMSDKNTSILVVDDNASLRTIMSIILTKEGYHVRGAADGFSALLEIRRKAPDLLLSDLNMPSMSGFELLSVVRRRFLTIRVVAMSGAFSGSELPLDVAADAFYGKGGNKISALMCLIGNLLKTEWSLCRQTAVPVWISANPISSECDTSIVITCQECLRVFPQSPGGKFAIDEALCPHCCSMVQFAIVLPVTETDRTSFALAN